MGDGAATFITSAGGESWPKTYSKQQHAEIEALELDAVQKLHLHHRWLGAIERIDGAATHCRRMHNLLRVLAIVGGVIVSGLVGAGFAATLPKDAAANLTLAQVMGAMAFVLSLAVTAALALDEYFRYGARYRESRLVAELLRIEGSRFVARTDHYARYASHREAYGPFIRRVEEILERDAQAWVAFSVEEKSTQPAAEQTPEGATAAAGGATPVAAGATAAGLPARSRRGFPRLRPRHAAPAES